MVDSPVYKPRVAVLMATYNGADYLYEQLASIYEQIGIDLTLFVSDDASTDNTLDILSNSGLADFNILHTTRIGSSASNFMRLIRDFPVAEFDYVSLADQDDIWLPSKLINGISYLDSHRAHCYSSGYIFYSHSKVFFVDKHQNGRKPFDHLFQSAGPGCTYIMKSEFVSNFRRILSTKTDAELLSVNFHDSLLYFYAAESNYKWVIDRSSYILYRQHANNVMGANIGFSAALRRFVMIMHGWPLDNLVKMIEFISDKKLSTKYTELLSSKTRILINCGHYRRRFIHSIFIAIYLLIFARDGK